MRRIGAFAIQRLLPPAFLFMGTSLALGNSSKCVAICGLRQLLGLWTRSGLPGEGTQKPISSTEQMPMP